MNLPDIRLLAGCVVGAVMLAGCSSAAVEEPDMPHGDMPVTFSAAAAQSRAGATAATFTTPGAAFRVWGVFYDPTKDGAVMVFDGRQVTRGEDAWSYDGEEYWMRGFTYDFRALYPAGLTNAAQASYNVGSGANSSLCVEGFVADGTDLMAASDRRMVLSGNTSPQPVVDLKFRHLLSRVNFVGKTDDRYLGADGKPDSDVRTLRILGFKISGVANKGNWSGATFRADGSALGEWTPMESAGEYVADIPASGIALGNTPTPLFSESNLILAIPQSFTDLLVEIDYEYTTGSLGRQHATARLSGTWLPGKSYSYSFSINTHIFFDTPAVDDWLSAPINSSDFDITLP